MARRYYSSRNKSRKLNLEDLYFKLQHLYLYFEKKDYFKHKLDINNSRVPDTIKHKAALSLNFQPFPITKWEVEHLAEDNIFDVIEFLYDHVSKPGEYGIMTGETGYNYYDYFDYDDEEGKNEFRNQVNDFLCDYRDGYELSKDGMILSLGKDGLQHIMNADIIPYDKENVDNKIQDAILKWRNRHLNIAEKKEAIRELADVFEWLKKTKKLSKVLNKKDESALFEIANNFSIRHHDPKQKSDYDQNIWYSWIFHFYLATYHAVIRLLKKNETK